MKKILYILVLFFVISLVWDCKSSDPTKAKPGKKVAIQCDNGKAIRYHYDPETGSILEKGLVALPKNLTCKQAENLEEKEMFKLKREGHWVIYYKNTTNILAEGENKDNKREGEWKFYDAQGNLTKITLYKDGIKEGPEYGYFAGTKILRYEGQNQNDKKTGFWKYYSDKEHQCISQGNYVNDMKEGEWIECSQDPKTNKWYVSFKGRYHQELKDGPAETYYPDGKLLSKGNYRADLKCKENPPAEGEQACAKKIGKWVFYFPNGNIMEEGNYDANTGRRTGLWKEYYESGQLRGQGNRNHTKIGIWTFYDKEGKIIGQYEFKGNDFMASYCIEFENNKKVAEGPCTAKMIKYEPEKDSLKITPGMKQGKWKGYHPNGKLAWEGELLMDKRHGYWKIYDEAGNLIAEGDYNMGKKTGFWKEMENGKLVTHEYDMFGRLKK
ncbi:MAG: hypothetical protein KatS3mg129_2280 [Leptospiraceae bacterium]|nr:MAG: hypothetical protein KatS3mg129_2280 [Leptospiraceae bacterium]